MLSENYVQSEDKSISRVLYLEPAVCSENYLKRYNEAMSEIPTIVSPISSENNVQKYNEATVRIPNVKLPIFSENHIQKYSETTSQIPKTESRILLENHVQKNIEPTSRTSHTQLPIFTKKHVQKYNERSLLRKTQSQILTENHVQRNIAATSEIPNAESTILQQILTNPQPKITQTSNNKKPVKVVRKLVVIESPLEDSEDYQQTLNMTLDSQMNLVVRKELVHFQNDNAKFMDKKNDSLDRNVNLSTEILNTRSKLMSVENNIILPENIPNVKNKRRWPDDQPLPRVKVKRSESFKVRIPHFSIFDHNYALNADCWSSGKKNTTILAET